jgi:hypothetical protein
MHLVGLEAMRPIQAALIVKLVLRIDLMRTIKPTNAWLSVLWAKLQTLLMATAVERVVVRRLSLIM